MTRIHGSAGVSEIGHPSAERARAAVEVGAAIAHELSGPATALLLYVGDLSRDIDQRSAAAGEDQSLKLVADNALREVERICLLIKRLGEVFEAPGKEKAVAYGREVIGWWSGVRNSGAQTDPKAPFAADAKEILTPREYEVLGLIREGCSNKEGGLRMNISYRTFESHRAEVMRKFGAKNAADLIRLSSVGQDISASDRSVPNVGD